MAISKTKTIKISGLLTKKPEVVRKKFHLTMDGKGPYAIARIKGTFSGIFWCKGYDTYSFLKYIGGIAKKHPNEADFQKAVEFIKGI